MTKPITDLPKRWLSAVAVAVLWLLVGGSAQLTADAAITPKVTATRQGRFLVLTCEEVDETGRQPSRRDRMNPPEFAVYQDGQEIGSGSFEYG